MLKGFFIVIVSFLILLSSCQKLPPEAQFIEQNKITGVIAVDSKIKDKCSGFLFIIVRNIESPQPLAVKRIKNPDYPYEFTISPADVIIEDNLKLFQGDLLMYARTSKSGNPFEEGGYCESEVKTVKAGSRNIKIILDNYKE
ncbi:MAG: hypothetical protein N2Z81_00850 [Hydrogenothermaceae bacterium]|nr:hypothetical protein [Hydrogenothermaceae bacterium]